MKMLDLDYSDYRRRRRLLVTLVVAAVLLLRLATQLADYRELTRRLAAVESRVHERTSGSVQGRKPVTEEERREGKFAVDALRSLNTPWESLFEAVEMMQQQNPRIRLLGMHPNPERGTLILSGEAPDLAALMDYLRDMRDAEKPFHDVRLVNQRWKEAEKEDMRLAFTLSAGWRR